MKEDLERAQEQAKTAVEKLSLTQRETAVVQEGLESRARDAEAEVKHLTEKCGAGEVLVAEMTTKLAEADKLSRSLRAVLREKEDAVVALESGLALKQQEMQLNAAELQRRTALFDDDVAEYSARVKALEAAAVKMRAQVSDTLGPQ